MTIKTHTTAHPIAAAPRLMAPEIVAETHKAMLRSALVVSVLLNLALFIFWVTLQVSGAELALTY